MRASTASDPRGPLRVAELMDHFPRLPELAPLLGLLVAGSHSEPGRSWSGSGELGTVGGRIVEAGGLSRRARAVQAAEADRAVVLWGRVAGIVEALGRGEGGEAVELLIEQGRSEEGGGRTREAEGWFLAAHRVALERDPLRAPEALRMAARVARTLGRLEEAARRYEAAWRDAEDLRCEEDEVIAATGRGNVAVDQGQWQEARLWYERALARIGEEGPPRRERWQLFQNLAIVDRCSGALGEARERLAWAESEGERLGDGDAEVEVGNGWGQLLLAEGDPRGAELYFAAALAKARDPHPRVAIGVNLGEALLLQGRDLEAGEAAREAEAEALAGGVIGKLPEVYRLLAGVAGARRSADAFVFLEQGLALIREASLPPFEEALTREAYGEVRIAEGERERGIGELTSALRIHREIGLVGEVERLTRRLAELDATSLSTREEG